MSAWVSFIFFWNTALASMYAACQTRAKALLEPHAFCLAHLHRVLPSLVPPLSRGELLNWLEVVALAAEADP
eukprot:CAMPEP_0169458888 /NCGR_PEP_ID=MMETSP1042-20121227/17672_1 /TAXON_ID=464988 /ORGANISM="Hemiselmis andersenii, Strain CCMP1180" /LENGTH=71 /DNA_ID=CAMNT_0009571299 /DNA_START=841 /DNA_END=1056 /DNA_ORIENTATION=+